MLSFLKQKLSGDVTEGVRIAVAENVTDGWSQDVASVAEDLRLDIYDHIRSIRDPEKPQNLEELNVVVESLVHVYPINGAGDKFVAQIEFVPTVPHCLTRCTGCFTISVKSETPLFLDICWRSRLSFYVVNRNCGGFNFLKIFF